MSLSDKTVSELITILKEEFGVECTQEEASETAESLVRYIEILQEISTTQR
jgi:acyl carrier protein